MKQIEFKTSKGEFVVIELPKEVKEVENSYCDAILTKHHDGYIETYYPFSDNDSVQEVVLISRIPNITEEQAKEVVDEYKCFITEDVGYQDYKSESDLYRSATISLHSLLEANRVVFDYDRNNCPNYFCDNGKIDVGYGEYMSCSLCEESQSKVWNKENTYLFKKI